MKNKQNSISFASGTINYYADLVPYRIYLCHLLFGYLSRSGQFGDGFEVSMRFFLASEHSL